MRILVTGARGKVGSATVAALADAGHDVSATDMSRPRFEADAGGVPYRQGDLTDAGDAFALVRGHDAVVHTAAIPDPMHNPPHVVFANNLTATFNVIEAAVRFGVPRVVNLSSETVPGFFFPERPFLPDYVPVDEQHPIRPQDPYATAKHFGEQLMDAATRRSDLTGISIRPSWVQWEGNIEDNLGPWLREPVASEGFWAYIDVYDLADAIRLAAEATTPAHEVVYIASPDIASHETLATLAERFHGDAAPEIRPSAEERPNGISIAKARGLIGYDPQRSWRDYLEDDGRLRPAVRERLERGATGVQRGRRMTGATGPPGGA
jgi:nucleoside-diphosphate-sugar epimerase